MLQPHLLKGEDSVGERRVRAQFQELPGACINNSRQQQKRHCWELEEMIWKMSMTTPVVATYPAKIRRSSVCRVLFEKENIEICMSESLLAPELGNKFFKNEVFSCCFCMAMLMTPPPLLPSSPGFLSAKMSFRCPSGSC
jgi:hypothetical protein